MRKLIMIVLPLITASSAFAGDFEQAAQTGHGPTSCTAAFIAAALLVVGSLVWCLWDRRRRLPVISISTILASIMVGQAGDFADAADRGYRAWSGRSDTAISGINAIGRGSDWVYNHPLESLTFVYHFDSSGSTPRETAGALLDGMSQATAPGTMMSNPGDLGMAYGGAFGAVGGPAAVGVGGGGCYSRWGF